MTTIHSIADHITEDAIAMERSGDIHGWAARFKDYADALRGHTPVLPKPPTPDDGEDIDDFVQTQPEGGK